MFKSRLSRYPLLRSGSDLPVGIVHVKDILYQATPPESPADWLALARPYLTLREDTVLDDALVQLQRERRQAAIVVDPAGRWIGIITLEDIIEEIVGKVSDEFRVAAVADQVLRLTPARVVLGLESETLAGAISELPSRMPPGELPDEVRRQVLSGAKPAAVNYLGNGAAVVQVHVPTRAPVLVFGRSEPGIPLEGSIDRMHLLFLVLMPAELRTESEILARIGDLMESEYIRDRLFQAESPEEVVEVIRAGIRVTLD